MNIRDCTTGFAREFERFWLNREPVANVQMARVLLGITALWVVLSRFDLPSVLNFPVELWQTVPLERRLRFLIVLPVAVERALWIVLHLALLATIAGWKRPWPGFLSGLLLYHFAPLETLIWTPNPYLRGLTIPCLGLLLTGFAEPRGDTDDSISGLTAGWGLRATQALLCSIYFFAGYAKLFWSGIQWASAQNMRLYLLALGQYLRLDTPVARWLANKSELCSAIAVTGLVFEILFPVVLVSRRARYFFIPAAVAFHVANAILFHVFFHDIALLLIFVNWQWLFWWLHGRVSWLTIEQSS